MNPDFTPFEKLLGALARADVAYIRLPFLGPEGLILLKQDSVREKDRIDVLALRKLLPDN